MFDILSKELYFLKQGSGGNVAKFGVHLSQQVKILQLEYLGRIQPEYSRGDEVRSLPIRAWATNINECWPIKLMVNTKLATPIWSSSPEVGKMGRSQRSSTPGGHHNRRIKNNSFSDTRGFVSLPEVEGQSYLHHLVYYSGKQKSWRRLRHEAGRGRRGWVFSWRRHRNLEWCWGTDQSVGYIVCFANVVELYHRRNQNCFKCGSPDYLVKDCPKDLNKTTKKLSLNTKEGRTKKGGRPLRIQYLLSQHPLQT